MQLDQSQLDAVQRAVSTRFAIINGGAGYGKTTIIKAIAERIQSNGGSVNLCAFAGKAAARLREATGIGASTIHSMLGFRGNGHFAAGPLHGYSIICDESSMVASDLLAEIVRREPDRLILVGDEAQLPPVGSGQPFHDLIQLRPEIVSTLTTCYRNSEAIFKAAQAIRSGGMPLGYDETSAEKWRLANSGGADATHRKVLEMVEAGELDFAQDVLLVPRNGDSASQACTVAGLNADIVKIVNPRADAEKIKEGDRIINTHNCPELDIWNGTTGSVHAIDYNGGIWIKLDTPIVDYGNSTPEQIAYTDTVLVPRAHAIKHLQLAYALTVHKAQGSQYRKVVFCCLCRDQHVLIDRAMLYTGVTRAKHECVVMGEIRAVQDGIRTVKSKATVLQELQRQQA